MAVKWLTQAFAVDQPGAAATEQQRMLVETRCVELVRRHRPVPVGLIREVFERQVKGPPRASAA